jgi:putative ABC transport system ATP-binding protein
MTENHPTAGCPEPDLVRSVEDMQIQPSDLGLIARVAALGKRYGHGDGSVTALDDVSLGLRRGEFTAIMGPSGSGKSTLMHIMAGLDSPTSGRVWLGDTDITQLSDSALTVLRRRRIGFVFQSFNLVPWIDELIDTLGLGNRLRHRPHELSGGQQQRVAIARALATRPDLVFADEPTGNLDSRTGREVLGLLAAASARYGQSIAMVTHDPVAASHADRILFLADGRIVRDAPRSSAEEISSFMLSMEMAA